MRRRRKPLRKLVPRAERVAGIVILCLLAVIAAAVVIAGRKYDPRRFALDPALLSADADTLPNFAPPEVAGGEMAGKGGSAEAGTTNAIAGGDPYADVEADAPAAPAGDIDASVVAALAPLGLAPAGPAERYDAETLHEKINGRAETYISFGCAGLYVRSFSRPGAGSVDLFIFDMTTPAGAFGIFALERDPAAAPLDFTADGYADGPASFLRLARYYIQLLPADETPSADIARALAAAIPADDAGLDAARLLPAAGQDPATLTYTAENAQGQAFLRNVFEAQYDFEGTRLPFFVMAADDEAAARDAYDQYLAFARQLGRVLAEREGPGAARVFEADLFGSTKILWQRGSHLGGVAETAAPAAARKMVDAYLEGGLK